MKKRTVVRSHIILLIEGRLLLLFCIGVSLWALWIAVSDIRTFSFSEILPCLIFILLFAPAVIFVIHWFWQLCFYKLIVTDEYIQWRCLFCKSITLPIADVKYVKVTSFNEGNMLKDINMYHAQEYVLLSTTPLPRKRIDKIRSGGNLIRVMYTTKLARVLGEALGIHGGVFRFLENRRRKR